LNLYVKIITDVVHLQHNETRKIYQNAVEANFSHEQMTPLNSMQNNAEIMQNKIDQIMTFKEENKK
jgi:hypothetical protein